jgi:hypothetical protein
MPSAENESVRRVVEKTTAATRIGLTDKSNPFFDWSAEIVEILPDVLSQEPPPRFRKRNIERMHKFDQKQDTVASIKIIKESVTIAEENNPFQNLNDNFRNASVGGFQGGLDETDVLFETTNFVLQATGETDSEKFQILDNFGELPQIFMFGRRPRIYSYSGMLWNHVENNWKDEFKYIYKTYLRGTKCIEHGVKVLLTFDRSVRMGYVLNANINQNAEVEMAVPFNFTMFIENEKELIDIDAIDPSSTNNTEEENIESAFYLIREQRKQVTRRGNKLQTAINKKLEVKNLDKPKFAAPVKTAEVKTNTKQQHYSNKIVKAYPNLAKESTIKEYIKKETGIDVQSTEDIKKAQQILLKKQKAKETAENNKPAIVIRAPGT